jgi:hypothetical protein
MSFSLRRARRVRAQLVRILRDAPAIWASQTATICAGRPHREQRSGGASGVRYVETRSSLWQAGHLTNLGSSSSNHERPHSQRILYTCCTVTVPHFSSWTSIPLAVAPCGGAPLRPTPRPSGANLPAWVVRSLATGFMAKCLTVLSVSHACSRGRAVRGRSRVVILDGPEQLESH